MEVSIASSSGYSVVCTNGIDSVEVAMLGGDCSDFAICSTPNCVSIMDPSELGVMFSGGDLQRPSSKN